MGFPEPLGRYGAYQLFTVEEFKARWRDLGPGTAYYATQSHEDDAPVDPEHIHLPRNFTHIVWYAGKTHGEITESWMT